jgi:hypothetical protein
MFVDFRQAKSCEVIMGFEISVDNGVAVVEIRFVQFTPNRCARAVDEIIQPARFIDRFS